MADLIGFYLVELPIYQTHQKKGSYPSHRIRPLTDSGIMYGNGCLKHNCKDCFSCPEKDCDYNDEIEYKLRKQLREG